MAKKHKMLNLSEEVLEELDSVEVQSYLVEDLLRQEFDMELKYPEHLANERRKRQDSYSRRGEEADA